MSRPIYNHKLLLGQTVRLMSPLPEKIHIGVLRKSHTQARMNEVN